VTLPEAKRRRPSCSQTNLKEFVMNETLDLEIVELGQAKEVTKGPPSPIASEENASYPERL
jgi:hypothetical protein